MSYFRETRNVELSTLYYLQTQINANWTGVTLVKSFKQVYGNSVALPVVCAILNNIESSRWEIGSNLLNNEYIIQVDIFATSDGQRLDLADFIFTQLQSGYTYYTHSQTSGDPTSLTRTEAGRVRVVRFITNTKVDLDEDVDEKDRFRHFISLIVTNATT